MAIDSNLITGPLAASSWVDQYAPSLAALAGITGEYTVTPCEFDGANPVRVAVTGTGAITVVSANSGVVSCTAGNGAAVGTARWSSAALNGSAPIHCSNLRTQKWGMMARFALTTTTHDAGQSRYGCGWFDTASNPWVAGLNAATSGAFFSFAGVASTTAIDTSYHNHKVWNDGTTVYYQVDDGAIASGSSAAILLTNAAEWAVYTSTGTGFAVVGSNADKIMIVTPVAS